MNQMSQKTKLPAAARGAHAAAPEKPRKSEKPEKPVDERLCNHCGKCCYKKIIVGRTVYITPFPCEFLDTNSNLCTVYDRRHELNPQCLSVNEGMQASAFPADCPYVPEHAPDGYKPAREDYDWAGEWHDLDALAEDLEAGPEMLEKVRARGPHAMPMYLEATLRMKQGEPQPSPLRGEDGPRVVDAREDFPTGEVPQLAALAAQARGIPSTAATTDGDGA